MAKMRYAKEIECTVFSFFQANDRGLELEKNKNAEKYILFSKNSLKIFFQRGIF